MTACHLGDILHDGDNEFNEKVMTKQKDRYLAGKFGVFKYKYESKIYQDESKSEINQREQTELTRGSSMSFLNCKN